MDIFDKVFTYENEGVISGLTLQLEGIYLYKLFEKENKNILYITSTTYEANQMYQILADFTDKVLLFPMDDFLTSEALASSPEFLVSRLETLNEIIKNESCIVITNLMGYLRFLPERSLYEKKKIELEKGKDYSFDNLIKEFTQIGYTRDSIVTKTGEVALRGFVIDIFPISNDYPVRIEFWGDTIDSIKIFDIETQRTLKEIKSICIMPNTEFLTYKEVKGNIKQRDLINYDGVSNISEYLEDHITVYHNYNEILKNTENLLNDINAYSKELYGSKKVPFMHDLDNIEEKRRLFLQKDDSIINSVKNTHTYTSYELQDFNHDIKRFKEEIIKYLKNHKTIVICLKNKLQKRKIEQLFEEETVIYTTFNDIYEGKINIIDKNIYKGFIIDSYVFIGEADIFYKEQKKNKYKTQFKYGTKIKDLTKLSVGDYVVHSVHGIGRYVGLTTLTKNGIQKDYLSIEYKGGDKLYIPVEKIDFISKYSSNESLMPRVNKLGGTEWQKTKIRVKKKLESIATELLELYALREASEGVKFDKDSEEQAIFEAEFEYEETKDQIRVMEEIKNDMESKKAMDRLVCGDVGYGKTELAFRSMFKAVVSGYQAAYLCPTTILSDQHYKNAVARFQDFPITIKLLNRFTTPKNIKETLKGLEEGTVDIVIGTHRLLSNDVKFKKLGLLIVDEEQRFGVKHKEKIKEMKNNIDVLTLSATPIPRTLQMSMTGLRSLSLLETPPTNRFPVQTYVLEENHAIIKDAIYKELSRGGQAFILYNYVEDMELKKAEIERLVPDAKIVSAHGQMPKNELEGIMQKFIDKEYDVLLCTTIIETGIDIPNVNTLLIMDADRFGLSQLYQIRGRVGRSDRIAYCYLMYRPGKTLTDVANKRLNVIKEFTELGSGFSIAMRDLSIRGAGDILGSEQAGYIDSVGIELYLKMLEEQVAILKGEAKEETVKEQPLIDVATAIEDKYIDDVDLKIEVHKKINTINSLVTLNKVKEELEDRFGKLSDDLVIYMHEEWFEKYAHQLGVEHIRQTKNFIEIMLPKEIADNIDGEKFFFELIEKSKMFRFGKRGSNLLVTLDIVKLDKHFIYYLIDFLTILEHSKKGA